VIFMEPGKSHPTYFFYSTFARKIPCANVELIKFELRTLHSQVEFYVSFKDTLFDIYRCRSHTGTVVPAVLRTTA